MCSGTNIHVNDQSPLKSNFVFPSIHLGGYSDKSVIVFSESNIDLIEKKGPFCV